jgi:hypothetical protein
MGWHGAPYCPGANSISNQDTQTDHPTDAA